MVLKIQIFSMTFHNRGVEHIFVKDYILHQYHDKYDPPLNHFDSIIKNAQRYQKKWSVLPMQKWLKAFEELDLIKIDQYENIKIIQKTDSQSDKE